MAYRGYHGANQRYTKNANVEDGRVTLDIEACSWGGKPLTEINIAWTPTIELEREVNKLEDRMVHHSEHLRWMLNKPISTIVYNGLVGTLGSLKINKAPDNLRKYKSILLQLEPRLDVVLAMYNEGKYVRDVTDAFGRSLPEVKGPLIR